MTTKRVIKIDVVTSNADNISETREMPNGAGPLPSVAVCTPYVLTFHISVSEAAKLTSKLKKVSTRCTLICSFKNRRRMANKNGNSIESTNNLIMFIVSSHKSHIICLMSRICLIRKDKDERCDTDTTDDSSQNKCLRKRIRVIRYSISNNRWCRAS